MTSTESAPTPLHGAAIGMPDARSVVSEMSLSADRISCHSRSPTNSQPRAATKSRTLCFLVIDGTLVLRYSGVVLYKRLGEIVSTRSIGLRHEIKVVGIGGGEHGF